ncbi:hypothetical protein R5R35_009372 [Gryllus longicercus]|uniref:Sugar phosphate transporter domain-containing protein n=1 Tax=Gryllus longicercus TaxID=2509291 RepID=A0AAN9Z0L8_9ORTH
MSEQKQVDQSVPLVNTFSVICRSLSCIILYLVLSIGIVFYQRWILMDLQFPLSMVLCHLTVKFILAGLCRNIWECCTSKERIVLQWGSYIKNIGLTGIAGGIDIGLSNWGLHLITVSLYTMTKSTAIIFILIFTLIFRLEKKSWSLIFVVLMISVGLFLTTYKATEFNLEGFLLILGASFASGLRWTLAQLMMQKSKLGLSNPLDMLYHMQPWMMWPLLPLAIAFEATPLITSCRVFRYAEFHVILETIGKVLLGSVVAFAMEVAEFLVVSYTSSLTLSVAGVCKDIFTLILAVEWAGDPMNLMKLFGLVLCLSGISCHSYQKAIDMRRNQKNITAEVTEDQCDVNIPLLTKASLSEALIPEWDNDESDDSAVLFNMLHEAGER